MDTGDNSKRGAWRDCLGFLALALVYRIVYLLLMPRVLDSADAIHYIDTAKHFAMGDFWGFNAKIPILYPLLAAAVHSVMSDYEWSCVVVSLIASTLLILPVYNLSRDLHGRSAARVMALLVAIWPWLVDYASRVGPDALGCTLWFMSIWTFARAMRRGGAWIPASAFAFFGLHLTRPEGTVLLGAACLAVFFFCVDAERGTRDWRVLARLLPFAILSAILLGAYVLYMRSLTGSATINYRAHFIVEEFVFTRMAATAVRTFSDVLPVMLGPVLLLFLGAGFFMRGGETAPRRDFRFEAYVLFFAAVQWAASLSVLSPEPRYLMSTVVALALWSARGIAVVGSAAADLKHGRALRVLPVAAMVAMMLLGVATSIAAQHLDRQPAQPLEYKMAGRWMKAHLDPGLIFTRKPQIGYYADMPSSGPDTRDTLPEAIARARNIGARYVVVDERYTAQMTPSLAALLDPAQAPADLELIQSFNPFPRSRVVVYRLLPTPAGS